MAKTACALVNVHYSYLPCFQVVWQLNFEQGQEPNRTPGCIAAKVRLRGKLVRESSHDSGIAPWDFEPEEVLLRPRPSSSVMRKFEDEDEARARGSWKRWLLLLEKVQADFGACTQKFNLPPKPAIRADEPGRPQHTHLPAKVRKNLFPLVAGHRRRQQKTPDHVA